MIDFDKALHLIDCNKTSQAIELLGLFPTNDVMESIQMYQTNFIRKSELIAYLKLELILLNLDGEAVDCD